MLLSNSNCIICKGHAPSLWMSLPTPLSLLVTWPRTRHVRNKRASHEFLSGILLTPLAQSKQFGELRIFRVLPLKRERWNIVPFWGFQKTSRNYRKSSVLSMGSKIYCILVDVSFCSSTEAVRSMCAFWAWAFVSCEFSKFAFERNKDRYCRTDSRCAPQNVQVHAT